MNTNGEKWAVIFDIDGTMVNNMVCHREAWFELCRRHGMEMNAEIYHQKVHARSNDKIVPSLFGNGISEEFIRRIEDEKEAIYRKNYKPVMKEAAGLSELLNKLKVKSVPCGAASNSPKVNVEFVLDGLGVREYFKSVLYRDNVRAGKPNPELFLRTAEVLGVMPQRCVVFEDSSSGFKAARAAGMAYVVIKGENDPGELVEAYDAKGIYNDFKGICPEMLEGLVLQNG